MEEGRETKVTGSERERVRGEIKVIVPSTARATNVLGSEVKKKVIHGSGQEGDEALL